MIFLIIHSALPLKGGNHVFDVILFSSLTQWVKNLAPAHGVLEWL